MKSSQQVFANSVASRLRRFADQRIMFADMPTRMDLLGLDNSAEYPIRIFVNVWRNHAFETLATLVPPFLALRNAQIEFNISGYDESFSFSGHRGANVELIWMDCRRLTKSLGFSAWLLWLTDRLAALRSLSNSPIVLCTWVEDAETSRQIQTVVDSMSAVYFAELHKFCETQKLRLLDERSANLAGTSIGNKAQVVIARELACHWLPALFFPPVKAVALDLDNTLHAGVLGEDGPEGVLLTEGHRALQCVIRNLKDRGVFLALVSRNELPDVESLFARRQDYPLRLDDFSSVKVSWGEKAVALTEIAMALRISTDSMLFVDDNLGELANVVGRLPDVLALHADEDAYLTSRAIDLFPGLWRWRVEGDDLKRIADMKANSERTALAQQFSGSADYLQSLQVKLVARRNPHDQVSRLADLCSKTNQFNISLRRITEAELIACISKSDHDVVSVQLSDRLSDSGVIAVVVGKRVGSCLSILELCISCRAMGRQLEDAIINTALSTMSNIAYCDKILFELRNGPRNQPARRWLGSLLDTDGDLPDGTYMVSTDIVASFEYPSGLAIAALEG